jgi:hypothetical protein
METNKKNEAFKITGDWAPQAAKLKTKFNQLTDADLKYETGKESDLINRIGLKINKKHEEIIDIIKMNTSN